MQGAGNRGTEASRPALDHLATYTINARALRKWSQERLQLSELADGGYEVRFLYEGTTCSNLGQPLQFEYRVQLSPRAQRYQLVTAECQPRQGDDGYMRMCEYMTNGDGDLMNRISTEKPLLGKPLDDVLRWERVLQPVGLLLRHSTGRATTNGALRWKSSISLSCIRSGGGEPCKPIWHERGSKSLGISGLTSYFVHW